MQKMKYAFCLALFLTPIFLMGQEDVLRLQPYTKGGQFLNDLIVADTLADGSKPAGRVYELQRGGLYLVNATIRNAGWNFVMRANDSAGYKPIIMLYPTVATGAPPGAMVDQRGNLNFKSLHITGYYEPVDTNVRNLQGQLIGTGAAGFDMIIDSCVLSNTNGNHLRTNSAPKELKVTNTIFINMGYLGRSNLGAGKGIDVRAGSVDTLLIRNCTFVNWLDRPIRHFNSTLPIQVFIFDHNTLVNGCSYHGLLSLGKVEKTCTITNNVLLDPFAMGNDTDATRQAEFTNSGEKDEYGFARMTWVMTEPAFSDSVGTVYTVSNNYYAISDSGQAFFDRHASEGVTGEGSPLTYYINSKIADSTKAFTKVKLNMKAIPALMTELMDWYRDPAGGNKTKNTPGPTWDDMYDMHRVKYTYIRDTLNCKIEATATTLLKMVASDGNVIGDPRWGAPSVVVDPTALITVDGEKDAFYSTLTGPSDGYLQLTSAAYNNNGAPKNDADLSAKMWSAWDNDWFYFYTEVKDDTVAAVSNNSYQNDGLELKFDPQPKDSVTNSIWGPNLTILHSNTGNATAGGDSLNTVTNPLQKQWARKILPDGYALELAINWPAIGTAEKVSVGVDSVFGLAINIHDDDGNALIGGGRQASIMWSAVMLDAAWNTPKYLGTVKFKAGNKLEFIAQNNMTPWRVNTQVKYDGTDPSLSVQRDRTGVPTEFAVGQNYPNPFNPSTTIKYQLPVSGLVSLKVYNFLGQEVATLVNEHQDAAYYVVKFDASKLSSGVYFYTVKAGNYTMTKKMLLIK